MAYGKAETLNEIVVQITVAILFAIDLPDLVLRYVDCAEER